MSSERLGTNLERRAHKIANRRAAQHQLELAQILQEASPDGDVQIVPDGRVTLRARRLFARMMSNEKLRYPISFLNGDLQ